MFYVILTTGKHNFIHLPFYGEKNLADNGKDTLYHTVPPFKSVNQDGDTISDKTLDGKIYIANYFYTACNSICPKMTTELLRVQEKFEYTNGMVQIISHTVKPLEDSVPVLKAYANMVHSNGKIWSFLTGDKKQLFDLARNGYLLNTTEGHGDSVDFIPLDFFILVDKEKHIRGVYNGTKIKEVNNLIDDVKVLMAEYLIKDKKKNNR